MVVAPAVGGHLAEGKPEHGLCSLLDQGEEGVVERDPQDVVVARGHEGEGGDHVEIFIREQGLEDAFHALHKPGAGDVQGVVGLREVGQQGFQRGFRGLGQRRHLDAQPGALIGVQAAQAPREGADAEPGPAGQGAQGEHGRGLDQLLDALGTDDPVLAEEPVHGRVVAGHGPGVGPGRHHAPLGAADLQKDDGYPPAGRLARDLGHAAGIAEAFHEPGDDPGAAVVDEVVHAVFCRDDRLVARGGVQGDAQAPHEELAGDHLAGGAALADQADRPGAGLAVYRPAGEHVEVLGEVHEAQAVGTQEQDIVLPAEASELLLPGLAPGPGLGIARGDEQDVLDALAKELFHRAGHEIAPHHDHGEIRRALGQGVDGGYGLYPGHLGGPRVDRNEAPVCAATFSIAEQVAKPLVLVRCPDHRNAAG